MLQLCGQALLMAAWMFWQVAWSLVLGFLISAVLQTMVSADRIRAALGGDGARQIALASVAGAASSSCSYAAASVSRTLFAKGAGLAPSLAFLLASTNLVVELGIVLLLLMGWPFMAGEWIGGMVLIALVSLLVRATCPAWLTEAARARAISGLAAAANGKPRGAIGQRPHRRDIWREIAGHFAMDWSMLWKDLVLGFLIAGALSAFVPSAVWQALFMKGAASWLQAPVNALIGPLVGVLSFVCSIGNVPLAAVLWGSGVSFGGVLAFLFSDLIVLPLLDVYRRYYGWKMAAYIGAVFYLAMAASALVMDLAFRALGWIPVMRPDMQVDMARFSINYTFWLDLAAAAVALALLLLARRQSVPAGHCDHHPN
jgi:uncharacterized membrane protein YraQ (UPF0718 family)